MTTVAQLAKQYGFESLDEVAKMTGWTTQTLRNWHRDHPERLKIVLLGCQASKPPENFYQAMVRCQKAAKELDKIIERDGLK